MSDASTAYTFLAPACQAPRSLRESSGGHASLIFMFVVPKINEKSYQKHSLKGRSTHLCSKQGQNAAASAHVHHHLPLKVASVLQYCGVVAASAHIVLGGGRNIKTSSINGCRCGSMFDRDA